MEQVESSVKKPFEKRANGKLPLIIHDEQTCALNMNNNDNAK